MLKHFVRSGGMIVALVVALMAMWTLPTAAQESPSAGASPPAEPVMVGDTEVTWTGDWEHDAASSMDQQATFTQIDIASQVLKLLSYGEFQDESVADTNEAIDVFSDAFFEGAGATTIEDNGTGELADGTVWRMYSFDLSGTPVSFLITASQNDDGAYVVTSLTTNTSEMQDAITQVQNEFSLNGDGQLFEGVDAAEVTQGLSTLASPEASPEASPAA